MNYKDLLKRAINSPATPYALYCTGYYGSSDSSEITIAKSRMSAWRDEASQLVARLPIEVRLYTQFAPWVSWVLVEAAIEQGRPITVLCGGVRSTDNPARFAESRGSVWYRNPGFAINTAFDTYMRYSGETVDPRAVELPPTVEFISMEDGLLGVNRFEVAIVESPMKWRRLHVQLTPGGHDTVELPYDHPWFRRGK